MLWALEDVELHEAHRLSALKELRAWWQSRESSKNLTLTGPPHVLQQIAREAREGFLEQVTYRVA